MIRRTDGAAARRANRIVVRTATSSMNLRSLWAYFPLLERAPNPPSSLSALWLWQETHPSFGGGGAGLGVLECARK